MDLARHTLFNLSEHDWIQRYGQSLINYDGRIWFVSGCGGLPIKMRMKDITVKGMEDEDDDGRSPLEKAEGKLYYWIEEKTAYESFIRNANEVGKVVDKAIMDRYKTICEHVASYDKLIAELKAIPPPVVIDKPEVLVAQQHIKIDPEKISLERPRAGWYSFPTPTQARNKVGYLYYKSEKQFCRGFSLKANCNIFSAIQTFDWADLASLLKVACFGPKIGRQKATLEDLLAVPIGGHKMLSRQIVVQANPDKEKRGLIYYRTKRVATYNEANVAVSAQAFSDELQEVLAFKPEFTNVRF